MYLSGLKFARTDLRKSNNQKEDFYTVSTNSLVILWGFFGEQQQIRKFQVFSGNPYFTLLLSKFVFRFHFPLLCRKLHITSERLGAGGGYDTVHAGYYRSYSHCTFRGATPPLAPNRQLYAGFFYFVFRALLFDFYLSKNRASFLLL
jgi:hypothetical protein